MNSYMLAVVLVITSSHLGELVSGKACTNTIPASHTFRYELLTSKNQTWKNEILSHYHLTPTDDSAWSTLLPRKMLTEDDDSSRDWAMAYKKIKHSSGRGPGGISMLKEVSLHDVRLDPNSVHGRAQRTNLEYLLMLDVDRLVWSFRKTAGLESPGEPYGGWEGPDVELRGHFVGHYLSASAQMWASTHNDSLREKMTAVVSSLSACQRKFGTGYLSAFPTELFDRLESLQAVWAPYYTIHKILAGLLDQYTFAGNDEALKMAVSMVDYFYKRVQNVISKHTIERHWSTLNEEAGGMNDFLYKLYRVTGDQKHLLLGHLFDKPCFLGLLAVKADDLSEFHSNTHIPVVIGSQMRYEVTGDPLYKDIGIFFMDILNSSHSYATGGTSYGELWTDPKRLADTLGTENEESCTTYNMLKVSRHLFRWTKEMAYADYYERALNNGVLSIQRGRDPGVMIYMLPLGRGVSKAVSYHGWGTQFDSFWCCYGTGIESFSKLGDSIYFEEEEGTTPSLYVIQYVSSSFRWGSGKISMSQEVDNIASWDPRLRVSFTVAAGDGGGESVVNFRIPLWTGSNGGKAMLNGQDIPLPSPGKFLSVSRKWIPGDNVTLDLPLVYRTEAIKDDRAEHASLQAIFYGPYLLAGLSTGDWALDARSAKSLSDWITPIPADQNSQLISLSQESGGSIFAITNSNGSLTMQSLPQPGTNSAMASTFRLVGVGKLFALEPFDRPGMAVVHDGAGKNLAVSDSNRAVFRLVGGLDGGNDTVSLEAEDKEGCYVYSGENYGNGASVSLSCDDKSSDDKFKGAVSFKMGKGFSEYHPVSFVAKGVGRDFLMSPLYSMRDESYTVYFDVHS